VALDAEVLSTNLLINRPSFHMENFLLISLLSNFQNDLAQGTGLTGAGGKDLAVVSANTEKEAENVTETGEGVSRCSPNCSLRLIIAGTMRNILVSVQGAGNASIEKEAVKTGKSLQIILKILNCKTNTFSFNVH